MRKYLCGFSCALISLIALASSPFTVMLDWNINPDHAPLLVAQEKGFFTAAGLTVTLLPAGSGVNPIALVLAGKADMAITYEPSLLMQVDQGLPVVRVATLIDQPLACITVLQASSIVKLADLKGKTVGYAGSSLSTALLQAMLSKVGLDIKQLNLINVQMGLSQALIAGKVDAAMDMMRNVEPLELNSLGFKTLSFLPEDYGVPPYDELVLVVRRDHANDPAVQAFIKALSQGVHYVQTYPEAAWAITVKAYPNDLAPTKALANINHQIWLVTVPLFAADPSAFNALRYQAMVQFLYQHQLIKTLLKPSDYTVSQVQ